MLCMYSVTVRESDARTVTVDHLCFRASLLLIRKRASDRGASVLRAISPQKRASSTASRHEGSASWYLAVITPGRRVLGEQALGRVSPRRRVRGAALQQGRAYFTPSWRMTRICS